MLVMMLVGGAGGTFFFFCQGFRGVLHKTINPQIITNKLQLLLCFSLLKMPPLPVPASGYLSHDGEGVYVALQDRLGISAEKLSALGATAISAKELAYCMWLVRSLLFSTPFVIISCS